MPELSSCYWPFTTGCKARKPRGSVKAPLLSPPLDRSLQQSSSSSDQSIKPFPLACHWLDRLLRVGCSLLCGRSGGGAASAVAQLSSKRHNSSGSNANDAWAADADQWRGEEEECLPLLLLLQSCLLLLMWRRQRAVLSRGGVL